jgi:hypothetical protein
MATMTPYLQWPHKAASNAFDQSAEQPETPVPANLVRRTMSFSKKTSRNQLPMHSTFRQKVCSFAKNSLLYSG